MTRIITNKLTADNRDHKGKERNYERREKFVGARHASPNPCLLTFVPLSFCAFVPLKKIHVTCPAAAS